MLTGISLENLSDGKIYIPWSVGAIRNRRNENMEFWGYRISDSSNGETSELVVAPFMIDYWSDIWSLSLLVDERPGIFSNLTSILANRGINILMARSATTQHSNSHTLRFILDCRRYRSAIDGNYDYRVSRSTTELNQLKSEISVEFISDVSFISHDEPSVTLRRNNALWAHSRRKDAGAVVRGARLEFDSNRVTIPDWFLESVKKSYETRFETDVKKLGDPFGVLSFDNDYLLHVFMFYQDADVGQCIVDMRNVEGALAYASGVFQKSKFNILASKAWSSQDEEKTKSWFLLRDLEFSMNPKSRRRDIIRRIENEIKKVSGKDRYEATFHFPKFDERIF